jgi:hypothetical protein
MRSQVIGLAVFVVVATVGVAALFAPAARSQILAAPSFIPIGVAASGSTSTAWFHEPSSRQALACQTVSQGTNLSGIQCVATKLP